MFRCQICDRIVPAGTRATKVVLATRHKVYEARGQDPRERRGGRSFRGRRGPRKKKPYDKGGVGTEIVHELSACPSCAAEREDIPPEELLIAPPPEEISETETDAEGEEATATEAATT